MKKLYERNELIFSILFIVLYLIINMVCVNVFGMFDMWCALINTIFSGFLFLIIIYLNKLKYYGLVGIDNFKECLYFFPLLLIVSVNLWGGISLDYSFSSILFYVLNMINVGFIEEIIFRGFLFKAMEKDDLKSAIVVTSLTFGIGHILNLLNGADFVPTLLQICYSILIGFLFVTIFYKSKSLLPCIFTHSLVNALSIFNNSSFLTNYIAPLFLIIVPVVYSFYLWKHE